MTAAMATSPPAARERTLSVTSEFGALDFAYPDSGNMGEHVRAILTGKTYPLPARPPGYRFDTVVDIGANVGASALWFLAQRPRRLVCFEPARDNFAYLRRNVGSLPGVEMRPWALFDRDGESKLYHGRSQNMQHSLVRSIETGEATETIALRRASAAFAELGIDSASLLKVDTEGSEVPILTDLAAILPRVDMLYVEYHSERDRRDIERMLGAEFMLAFAEAAHPHRGVNLYLASRLGDAVPAYAAMALSRPS